MGAGGGKELRRKRVGEKKGGGGEQSTLHITFQFTHPHGARWRGREGERVRG